MTNKTILCAFVSLSTLTMAQGAFADTAVPAKPTADASGGGDIVVTARRKQENLQDVPISITALSGNTLTQRGITDALSLQGAVPSLTVTGNGANRVGLSYEIRGQRSQEVQLLTDSPVGTYFAEVDVPRSYGLGNEFYDLQDIQVLKGVQGTLFGRNMTGGAVLVEPAHPEFGKLTGEVKIQAGNYNMRDVYGMLNIPVIGDSVALRVDGKHRERDGFTTDIASGRQYDDQNYDTFRASLAIKSGRFTNNTIFDYLLEKENGSALKLSYVSSSPLDPTNGQVTTLAAAEGVTLAYSPIGGIPTQNLPAIFANDLALGKYTVNYGNPNIGESGTVLGQNPFLYLKNYGITNKTTFNAGSVTFKNIFGYRSINFQRESDYDGSSADLIYSYQYTKTENYSDEFQMQGKPFGDKFDLTLGAFYFSETGTDGSVSSQFPQYSAAAAVTYLGAPNATLLAPFSAFNQYQDAYARAISYAFYGAGTYTITPKLKLSGGIRYNNDLREATVDTIQGGQCSFDAIPGFYVPYTVANCPQSRRADNEAVTYDATLTYEPSRDLTAYAAVRHGYRAGGFGLRSTTDAQFAPFRPENVQEYEIGLKTHNNIGEAVLTTSAALFYQYYSDVQKQVTTSNNGNVGTIVVNTATQHDSGGELEANLRFRNGFGLSAYISYVDDKVISDTTGIHGMYAIPHTQLGGAVSYARDLEAIGKLNLNLNVAYKSSVNFSPYDYTAVQKGYALVNGRIDLANIGHTGIGGALFMNNIFDQYYALGGLALTSNGPASNSGGVGFNSLIYGEPRTWGFELSYKF